MLYITNTSWDLISQRGCDSLSQPPDHSSLHSFWIWANLCPIHHNYVGASNHSVLQSSLICLQAPALLMPELFWSHSGRVCYSFKPLIDAWAILDAWTTLTSQWNSVLLFEATHFPDSESGTQMPWLFWVLLKQMLWGISIFTEDQSSLRPKYSLLTHKRETLGSTHGVLYIIRSPLGQCVMHFHATSWWYGSLEWLKTLSIKVLLLI